MDFLAPGRLLRTGDDPIFALNAEATARRAAGEPVLNATVGMILDDEGKLVVIDTIPRAMRDQSPEVGAAYAPIAGPPAFKRAVIEDVFYGGRAGERAQEAAREAVAVATPGGSGALRHSIANFLERGQTLLTTSFYWSPYSTLADELDRGLAVFRFLDEDGRFDAADLERKLDAHMKAQGRALLFLNTPCHNPTGYSLDKDDWARAADVIESAAGRGPVAVLLDIAYARYGDADLSETVEAVLRLKGKALLLFAWSASKSFTQYGMRVGALIAVHPDPAVRRSIEGALSYSSRGTWSSCNSAGMAAVTRVLTSPELRARADHEREAILSMLRRRVATFLDLAGHASLRCPRYSGGFFSTVLCDDARAETIAERLRADGIFVVPLQGGLRLALSSVAERDMPRLVDGIRRRLVG